MCTKLLGFVTMDSAIGICRSPQHTTRMGGRQLSHPSRVSKRPAVDGHMLSKWFSQCLEHEFTCTRVKWMGWHVANLVKCMYYMMYQIKPCMCNNVEKFGGCTLMVQWQVEVLKRGHLNIIYISLFYMVNIKISQNSWFKPSI